MPVVIGTVLLSGAAKKHVPAPKPKPAAVKIEKEKPVEAALQPRVPDEDLSHAVPVGQISRLPSTAQQYQQLKGEIAKQTPAVDTAKQKSAAATAQAEGVRTKLMATVARVQNFERERDRLDASIASLAKQEAQQSAAFAHDRVQVSHLLAVLERLQYDMPPAMALKPGDALGAARGSMLIGASVPRIYSAAAALANRIRQLRDTRAALVARRAEGVRNAIQLSAAEKELDQLLAIKEREATAAATAYGSLQAKLDQVAGAAKDLASLMVRVASLRKQGGGSGIVVVGPQNGTALGTLRKGALLRPAVGQVVPGGIDRLGGAGAPGITFLTAAGAPVITPTDSKVLFAGPYHKSGQVLILESAAGYDLVLAGLERLAVKPDDQLLAGEPLGVMPRNGTARLYFEVRQNGKGMSPAPWLAVELRKAKRS